MENTNRKIITFENEIILTITFDKSIGREFSQKIVCYSNQKFNKIINDFLLKNNIKLKENYLLYLKRDNLLRKLEKNRTLKFLKIKFNDKIIVSYKKLSTLENSTEEIFTVEENKITNYKFRNTNMNEKQENQINLNKSNYIKIRGDQCTQNYKRIKKYIWILIAIVIIIILITISILFVIYYYKRKKKLKDANDFFSKEKDFVIQKRYPVNLLLRFNSKKKNDIEIKGANPVPIISELSDFIFIVRKQNIEKDYKNLIEKELYTGYIAFLNNSLNNQTHDILNIYDKKLNELFNYNTSIILKKPDLKYIGEKGNICFAKLEFYLNGEIKNYYLPEIFTETNFLYIEETAKLIIPKISSNLYVKSIDEKMNEIISLNNISNGSIDNFENIENNESFNYENRYLSKKRKLFNKNHKTYSIPYYSDNIENITSKRRLSSNYTNINYNGDIYFEEYLVEPLTNSINLELREANENSKIVDNNLTLNYSNLTQYSINNVECDEAKMEGSIKNSTIYSIIDKDGILKSVEQNSFSSMITQDYDNYEEIEYANNLKKKIYDKDNQLSMDDIKETKKEEELNENKRIKFDISSIDIINSIIINRSDYFENGTLNKKLYEYFDSFKYELYNNSYNNLSEKILNNETIEERNLEEDESYYGFKKLTYMKSLYNYNFLGLKMEKQIFTEINPNKGTTTSYFIIIFGNKNTKIKISEQQSNMHIILEKKNQMAYNLLVLLNQSNKDLKERNKNYIEIILDMEKNISNFFKDYDYSDIFNESLENLYKNVKNFSTDIFYEFISLVNNVYDRYTNILDNAKNEKYDFISKIVEITKEEYINYIYNMINLMEAFENNCLVFYDNVEKELIKIEEFQIDLLYDTFDIIYESKLIFNQFNNILFKSIEKGIITFKYDINDFIYEIIGDLLYITDFLSDNLNKNEIFKNKIDRNLIIDISIKLKNLKNIILIILDIPILNINKDYELEMNINNKKGIKNYSYDKENEFILNIEKKSNNLIENIKSKINDIELYELYTENINIINYLNNKSIIEYINDVYNYTIFDILNLKPEFINKESNIIKYRNKSLNISKDIVNQINKEINEINEFVFNYTNKYIEENKYKIDSYLYNFRKYFLEDEMKILLNQFFIIVNRTIIEKMKEMIDFNFDLSKQFFDERKKFGFFKGIIWGNQTYDDYFYMNISKSSFSLFNNKKIAYKLNAYRFYLFGGFCTSFVNKYAEYKKKYIKFLNLIYQEEFNEIIENLFYKIKNDLNKYVNMKINSINKYGFEISLYENNFKFIEQINKEILNIIDKMDNYFNENNYIKEINLKLIRNYDILLAPYHNEKMEEFDKYYNYLYNHILGSPKIMECNEVLFEVYQECAKKLLFFCIKYKDVYVYYNCDKTENINKVLDNIKSIENDLVENSDLLIKNFINKFDKSLTNLTSSFQNLYSNLYQHIEKKMNNSKINIFLNNYENHFYNNTIKDSKNYIMNNIYNKMKNIIEISENNSYKLRNNINLLKEEYFSKYLADNNKFLEYPEEIVYKINQLQEELIYNINNTKNKIRKEYDNRINKFIKLTGLYINNYIKQDLNFILTKLNSFQTIKKYYIINSIVINLTFENCFNSLEQNYNQLSEESAKFSIENNIFKFNEFNYKILEDLNNFTFYLNNLINKDFMIESCSYEYYNNSEVNITDELFQNITNEIICKKDKKRIDERYSKYNFNIIKLRTGIYYTKRLTENIYSLFNDFDFKNIININEFIYYDNLLNDKNLFNIYNETNNALSQIKDENNILIQEILDNLIEYLNNFFSFQNDYSNISKTIKEIITFKDKNYNNYTEFKNNETINNIFILFDRFNNTLFEYISLRENFDYYNFNETYFKEIYQNFEILLDNIFKDYKMKIKSFFYNNSLYNTLKNVIKKIQKKKIMYYKDILNDYSKNYNFNFLNGDFNVGDYLNIYMTNKFEECELTNIYDFYELMNNYTSSYSNTINKYILYSEKTIKELLKDIYDNFYSNFKNKATDYINYNFVENLEKNYSCLNYSNIILDFRNINQNQSLFNNINEIISIIYENCTSQIGIHIDIDDFSLNEKINFILNRNNNCFYDFYKLKNLSYYNETIHFLNCYNNDFNNYTAIYFNKINDIYKNDLHNIINSIIYEIKNNYNYENFLGNYLEENFQTIPYKEINLDEISNYFQGIESMISYINAIKKNDLNKYFFQLIISSFNESYFNLFNHFIINEIISNISILINDKLELQLDFISKKIREEYDYYLLILNNTELIGYSSKIAFINLYKKLNKILNEELFNFIQDDIYYYLDIFYRKNKEIFKNNFINFYINNLNQYNINIVILNDFIKENICSKDFNETIDLNLKILVETIIFDNIKKEINDSVVFKIEKLSNEINALQYNIEQILINIETKDLPYNMEIINELINNFTEILNSQNNQFLFRISNKAFNFTYNFIHDDLEPPLILIKNNYNKIEETILNDLVSIIESFPDYLRIIKNKFNLEEIYNNISLFFDYTNELLINYTEILDKDLKSYINKLVHYIFINGLYTLDEPCNESFCNFDDFLNSIKNTTNESENENEIKIVNKSYESGFNFPNLDKGKIEKLINKNIIGLNGYNSKMGAITENDINYYILEIKDTLFNFNKSYLDKDYKQILSLSNSFFTKINSTYLNKLKKNIDKIAYRFSSVLTKDTYNKLKINLYKQYKEIELYINNNSNLIEINKNQYLNLLNFSSELIKFNYNLVQLRIKNYYEDLNKIIQEKLKYISEEEMKNYKLRILEVEKRGYKAQFAIIENDLINLAKGSFYQKDNIFGDLKKEWERFLNGNFEVNSFLKFDLNVGGKTEMNLDDLSIIDTSLDICLTLFEIKKISLYFPIKLFPCIELGLKINPIINLQICINIGLYFNTNNKNNTNNTDENNNTNNTNNTKNTDENKISIGASGEASVGLNLELGLYIPSGLSPISISISVGITGILGYGKIGVKLNFYLWEKNKDIYGYEFYYNFLALQLTIYAKATFEIEIKVIKFSYAFEFYLYKKELTLFQYSYKKEKFYKLGNKDELKEKCYFEINEIINGDKNYTKEKCYNKTIK